MPIWDILTSFFDPVWFGQAFESHGATLALFGAACFGSGFALKKWLVAKEDNTRELEKQLEDTQSKLEGMTAARDAEHRKNVELAK